MENIETRPLMSSTESSTDQSMFCSLKYIALLVWIRAGYNSNIKDQFVQGYLSSLDLFPSSDLDIISLEYSILGDVYTYFNQLIRPKKVWPDDNRTSFASIKLIARSLVMA